MLDTITKGLDLASDILSYMRESDDKNREINERHHEDAMMAQANLITAIKTSSALLVEHIEGQTDRVIDKIEVEQLERISSTIEVMKLAIELENKALIETTLASLLPLSKYALTRLNEKKQQWFLPWIQSSSICLVALTLSADSERVRLVLAREEKVLRLEILNQLKQTLLSQPDVPWVALSDFVNGKSEHLLKLVDVKPAVKEVFFDQASLKKESNLHVDQILTCTVSEVVKKSHSRVNVNDVIMIMDIETNKVAVEFEIKAQQSGLIGKIFVNVGDEIEDNALLYSLG
ncbi:hypothetical protein L4C36_05545 [Photobacterium japonica]|uniref:biotin/lipoyl-containing protein n=1 Tax=Photobacterium japonica TaxID=2910235 RepID=UPI003D14132D